MEIPSIVTIFHANAQFNNKRGTLVAALQETPRQAQHRPQVGGLQVLELFPQEQVRRLSTGLGMKLQGGEQGVLVQGAQAAFRESSLSRGYFSSRILRLRHATSKGPWLPTP